MCMHIAAICRRCDYGNGDDDGNYVGGHADHDYGDVDGNDDASRSRNYTVSDNVLCLR